MDHRSFPIMSCISSHQILGRFVFQVYVFSLWNSHIVIIRLSSSFSSLFRNLLDHFLNLLHCKSPKSFSYCLFEMYVFSWKEWPYCVKCLFNISFSDKISNLNMGSMADITSFMYCDIRSINNIRYCFQHTVT